MEITRYRGSETEVKIPSELSGNKVTRIGDEAFIFNRAVEKVIIPDTVSGIGYCSFYACRHLENIVMPESITEIGTAAFADCSALISIDIPNSAARLGEWFLFDCASLQAINVLPSHPLLKVADGVLFDKSGRTLLHYPAGIKNERYEIPKGVTRIENGAFFRTKLKEAVLCDGITSIGERAFAFCDKLTHIGLPESLKEIGRSAFWNCYDLEHVIVPGGVAVIRENLFNGCSKLASVKIKEGVKKIERHAFLYCRELKEALIPESVTSFENDFPDGATLFVKKGSAAESLCIEYRRKYIRYRSNPTASGNTDLPLVFDRPMIRDHENVVIPEGVLSIEEKLFEDDKQIRSVVIPGSVSTVPAYTFTRCARLESIALSEGIEEIQRNAIDRCPRLKSIGTIPASLTKLDLWLFDSLLLEEFSVSEDNPCFSSCHGMLYNKEQTVLLRCPPGKKDDFVFNPHVTEIRERAFSNCLYLEQITVPEGITKLSRGTFAGCQNLRKVTLPESVVSTCCAFDECARLESVGFPGKMRVFDESFYGCSSLKALSIPGSVTEIRDCSFAGSGFESFVIPGNVKKLGESVFSSNHSLKSVTIEEGVEQIGNDAFYGCAGLTGIAIPKSVKSIGSGFCGSCSELRYAELHTGIRKLGKDIFGNCSKLERVTLAGEIDRMKAAGYIQMLLRLPIEHDGKRLEPDRIMDIVIGMISDKPKISKDTGKHLAAFIKAHGDKIPDALLHKLIHVLQEKRYPLTEELVSTVSSGSFPRTV